MLQEKKKRWNCNIIIASCLLVEEFCRGGLSCWKCSIEWITKNATKKCCSILAHNVIINGWFLKQLRIWFWVLWSFPVAVYSWQVCKLQATFGLFFFLLVYAIGSCKLEILRLLQYLLPLYYQKCLVYSIKGSIHNPVTTPSPSPHIQDKTEPSYTTLTWLRYNVSKSVKKRLHCRTIFML